MAKVLEGPGMALMAKWGVPVPRYVILGREEKLADQAAAHPWLKETKLVVKAHEAVGSRMKLGLVKVDLDFKGAEKAVREILGKTVGQLTVSQVIVSEMVPHDAEYYAAVKSTREGADILLASCGGIEIEGQWDRVKRLSVPVGENPDQKSLEELAKDAGFAKDLAPKVADFALKLFQCYDQEDGQYLEVNPLGLRGDQSLAALDAVVLLDGDARFRHPDWDFSFAAEFGRPYTENELAVQAVDAKVKGSVKLIEIPGGDIALLPAGGGASVFYSDAVVNLGGKIANY
ncbi:MAG: ATP citrate lyase, partial [Nitrospirae bacterium]|nr:ATP citrate lyase [Nitrospirota bacterium]